MDEDITATLEPSEVKLEPKKRGKDVYLGIAMKCWWLVFIGLLLMQFAFLIGGLAAPKWAEQGTGHTNHWHGSLLSVAESDARDIDSESYNKVADHVCDQSLRFGVCEMFEDLRDGGFIIIFYECLSIFFLAIWVATLVFAGLNMHWGSGWIGFVWPWLAFSSHTLGLILWMGLTEASFRNCDSISQKHRHEVCATTGPILCTFSWISYFILAALFTLVWAQRFAKTDKDTALKRQESEPTTSIVTTTLQMKDTSLSDITTTMPN